MVSFCDRLNLSHACICAYSAPSFSFCNHVLLGCKHNIMCCPVSSPHQCQPRCRWGISSQTSSLQLPGSSIISPAKFMWAPAHIIPPSIGTKQGQWMKCLNIWEGCCHAWWLLLCNIQAGCREQGVNLKYKSWIQHSENLCVIQSYLYYVRMQNKLKTDFLGKSVQISVMVVALNHKFVFNRTNPNMYDTWVSLHQKTPYCGY